MQTSKLFVVCKLVLSCVESYLKQYVSQLALLINHPTMAQWSGIGLPLAFCALLQPTFLKLNWECKRGMKQRTNNLRPSSPSQTLSIGRLAPLQNAGRWVAWIASGKGQIWCRTSRFVINSLFAFALSKMRNQAHRQFLCLGRSSRAALDVNYYSLLKESITSIMNVILAMEVMGILFLIVNTFNLYCCVEQSILSSA